MMPDHRRRAEPQCPAALLESPADIDVVAGNAVLRIKPADRLEASLSKRHIAAWYVLGLQIREEDMDGVARCVGDAIGDEPVAAGRNVRAAHASRPCAHKSGGEVG